MPRTSLPYKDWGGRWHCRVMNGWVQFKLNYIVPSFSHWGIDTRRLDRHRHHLHPHLLWDFVYPIGKHPCYSYILLFCFMILASGLYCPPQVYVCAASRDQERKKERHAIQHTSGITNNRMTTPTLAINKWQVTSDNPVGNSWEWSWKRFPVPILFPHVDCRGSVRPCTMLHTPCNNELLYFAIILRSSPFCFCGWQLLKPLNAQFFFSLIIRAVVPSLLSSLIDSRVLSSFKEVKCFKVRYHTSCSVSVTGIIWQAFITPWSPARHHRRVLSYRCCMAVLIDGCLHANLKNTSIVINLPGPLSLFSHSRHFRFSPQDNHPTNIDICSRYARRSRA